MILLLCVDKKMGLSFGGKRQSRDKAVTDRILSLTAGKKLYVKAESAALFDDQSVLLVTEDPAAAAGNGDFVFLERLPLPEKGVEGVVLFHWNRLYPATEHMTLDLAAFSKVKTEEYAGTSHDRITQEYWEKV